jgi:hypothetical protein
VEDLLPRKTMVAVIVAIRELLEFKLEAWKYQRTYIGQAT